MAKKRSKGLKRVGEVMDSLDTPHGEFNLNDAFMRSSMGGPPGPKASQPLLDAFRRSYEPVESEHLAQVYFSLGRLREYFGAWIIPKMPDPLPVYLEELECMGYPLRTGFDGSPCIMVRYRGSMEVAAVEIQDQTEEEPDEGEAKELPVYTDDWEDDLSDLPPMEDVILSINENKT